MEDVRYMGLEWLKRNVGSDESGEWQRDEESPVDDNRDDLMGRRDFGSVGWVTKNIGFGCV